MLWCVRCGNWFTPKGRLVRRSAFFVGEFNEPEEGICDNCWKPLDEQARNDQQQDV